MSRADPQFRLAEWLEQAWLERYFMRQLDSAECDWFETYVLHWPHLALELEADEALRAALSEMPVEQFQEFPTLPIPEHQGESTSPQDPGSASGPAVMAPGGNAPASAPGVPTRSRNRGRRAGMLGLAAAAGFLAALGLAPRLLPTALPAIADPPRYVYEIIRGRPSTPYAEPGNPAADYVIVEIAVPADARRVELGTEAQGRRRVLLAQVPTGPEGFASALISRRDFVSAYATVTLSDGQQREIRLRESVSPAAAKAP